MKEMVYRRRAADLVKRYGVTVVSPGYPKASRICRSLLNTHTDRNHIDSNEQFACFYTRKRGAALSSFRQHAPLDKTHIAPGVWNMFPKVNGDHVYLQGKLLRRHAVRKFYLDLLSMMAAQGH